MVDQLINQAILAKLELRLEFRIYRASRCYAKSWKITRTPGLEGFLNSLLLNVSEYIFVFAICFPSALRFLISSCLFEAY